MTWRGFRWEPDHWWWEKLRLDELGLPASWDLLLPDKLCHFLAVFFLAWLLSRWLKRFWAVLIPWAFMMGPWELILDGCFRYGASWKDMLANTLGALFAYHILGTRGVYGQKDPLPRP